MMKLEGLLVTALLASVAVAQEAPTSLSILFKQDPRLFGGTYGAQRWLSSPNFTSAPQPGTVGTVDVKVRGVDAGGRLVAVAAEWTAADPDMVAVASRPNDEYRITVLGAGESTLVVAAGGVSRALVVRARTVGGAIVVEIRQPAPSEPPRARIPPPAPDRAADDHEESAGLPGDRRARSSYALGLEMGEKLAQASMDLDVDLVVRGLKDAFDGSEALLTDEQQRSALKALRADFRTRQKEAREQLAERNRLEGEAFLAENRTKEGVVTLDSGLQYRVLETGSGPTPTAEDRVVCHYRGSLIDGTEFDSSYNRHKPHTMELRRAIKGWREALPLMPVGSRWQLFIPPSLAYGARGGRANGVGPNATLVFEVELLGIRETARAPARGSPNAASLRGADRP